MTQPEGSESNPMVTFLFMGGFILIFYFFMMRPQQKKAKEQKAFKEELKKGDKVITIGGIHGKVVDSKENTLTIQVDSNTKIKIEKSAVSMEMTRGINVLPTDKSATLPQT